jgi:hypothetical protein
MWVVPWLADYDYDEGLSNSRRKKTYLDEQRAWN